MPKRKPKIVCGLQELGGLGTEKKREKKKRVLANISNAASADEGIHKRKKDISLAEYVSQSVIEAVKETLHTKRKPSITEVKLKIPSQKAALALFKDIPSSSISNAKQEVIITVDTENAITQFLNIQGQNEKRIHPVRFGRGLSSSDGSTYVYAWANAQALNAIIRNRSMTITVTTIVTDCDVRPL